ncbi:S-layer homology domain-containing protein [Paenibacillus sp. NPDC057934]|uniref:S-layer homology domain-containing protein n=1 Tax=Paenibacillus sp. NPDC057934 TaxID=3346282 RepID=UPI0036DB1777
MNNTSTKYFLSALLIITTLFSSLGTAFGATSTPPSDVTAHWAQNEVTEWIEQGFINGYADGSFKPDNNIKRTEFIALINRSFGFTETATISYKDISSSNWAYTEVAKAVKAGYINGYSDGTIGVGKSISRQEAAVIINRLLKLAPAKNNSSFSDSNTIAPWALDSVNAVVFAGIMKGYSQDNSFKPGKDITRAEAVVALTRTKAAEPNSSSPPGSNTGTPAATVSPTPTPIISASPSPTPIYYAPSDPTATPTSIATPEPTVTPDPADIVAPTLTRVTIGSITVGENVYGTSNEDGYLYLVPATKFIRRQV